jgi:hypothetical protein
MVCVVEMTSQLFQESRFAMHAAVRPKAKDAHGFFKRIAMGSAHVHRRTVRTRFLAQHFEMTEQFARAYLFREAGM